MAEFDTKERILDAAERMFAEQGLDAVSLRAVIREAEVNLAAIHYHFGSKAKLIEEVFARRVIPINEERFRMLDEIEVGVGEYDKLELEGVLEAFFGPAVRMLAEPDGPTFCRLMGRMHGEFQGSLSGLGSKLFGPVADRFVRALERALPELPGDELVWRMHFMIAALAFTMKLPYSPPPWAALVGDHNDPERILRRLIAYTAGGMRARAAGGAAEGDME